MLDQINLILNPN